MPISRILGKLIAEALEYDFAGSVSFYREVKRDLSRLRTVLNKPARELSRADRLLELRYAGTAVVLRAN